MIEIAVAREVAIPLPPRSSHFEAPAWWPEWITQVLSTPTPARPARAAADNRHHLPGSTVPGSMVPGSTLNYSTMARTPAAPVAAQAPEAAYAAAVAALHGALREAREAVASADPGADDWAVTVAEHQVHLARRAVRALLDAAAAPGPGSRLEWCLCGHTAAAG
jgi:hypothetical protein